MSNAIYLIILSIIGFLVSFYIYRNKKTNKKMYCIISKDCDEVVKSKYGKTFGVENTVPGMIYYIVMLAYGILAFLKGNIFKYNVVYYLIVIASIASVLFSLYLIAVQAFILKKWCEYCVVSTACSVLILAVLIF